MTHPSNSVAGPHPCIDQWIDRLANTLDTAVKWQRRGNSLHILCEAPSCPDRSSVVKQTTALLQRQDINSVISPSQPPIYQLWCYGRATGDHKPLWSAAIAPGDVSRSYIGPAMPETSAREFSPKPQSSPTPQGDQGDSDSTLRSRDAAIAQRLAKILSPLGITVRARIKAHTSKTSGQSAKRLWVACQGSYSPDPSLIAEPLSYEIRQLQLSGVRDAVVLVKVGGEERIDWVLKIDLTPAEEILKQRAQWGDVEAIGRLLNQQLRNWQLAGQLAGGTLVGKTLRFTYQVVSDQVVSDSAVPDSAVPDINSGTGKPGRQSGDLSADIARVADSLSAYLRTLAPRGIHALQLVQPDLESASGQSRSLLASSNAAQPTGSGESAVPADSAWDLARAGDLPAVRFLIGQLLNPDLDQQLATGGIRVQVLLKDQLMHVMCDGPLCPDQGPVARAVQNLIEQLEIPSIQGVRTYGRRAGQRRPRWRSGVNFDKQRFVPEPSPAFAATDAYVTELVAPDADTDVSEPSVRPQQLWSTWQRGLQKSFQGLRRGLLRSQLFVPGVEARDLVSPNRSTSLDLQLAVVWGAVGLLLFTQADLVTGWWIRSRLSAAERPEATEAIDAAAQPSTAQSAQLAASQLAAEQVAAEGGAVDQVAADLPQQSPLPSFNNPQLDLKLALYNQRLQASGPPDVVVVGSSRAMRSLDPDILEAELADLGYADADIFNFGVNGATAQVVDLILRQVLEPQHLPELVVWADGARAFNEGRTDETYQAMVPSEGYEQMTQGTLPPLLGGSDADSEGSRGSASDVAAAEGKAASESPDNTVPWSSRLFDSYQAIDEWLSESLGRVSIAHDYRDRIKAWITQWFDVGDRRDDPEPALPSGTSVASQAAPDDPEETQDDQRAEGEADASAMASFVLSPSALADEIRPSGFLPIETRFDPSTYYQQYAQVPGNYDKDYINFQLQGAQTEALQQVLTLAEAEDVTVVFVNTPLTQEYLDPFRAGHEQTFRQYMIDAALQHDAFIFRDLSRLWLDQPDYHQYFSDPSHLNRYGAEEISTYLAQDPLIPWSATAD